MERAKKELTGHISIAIRKKIKEKKNIQKKEKKEETEGEE